MRLAEECRVLVTELRKGKQPEDFLLTRNGEPVRDFRGAWNALVIRQRDCRDCCSLIFAAAYRKRQREKFPAKTDAVFNRYNIVSEAELQEAAKKIEAGAKAVIHSSFIDAQDCSNSEKGENARKPV